ncbi:MAG: SGNH/GDSL hydrolase family protein [Bacilli bacterium]|nr:SGNH/GDSL hydrolase family protein [Bacilli bacterium]
MENKAIPFPSSCSANDARFDYANQLREANHPLQGRILYWLGSSVTEGSGADGQSMADYLAAKTGCICKKEAVSGTTFFEDGHQDSYAARLQHSRIFDPANDQIAGFLCQISTNDCKRSNLAKRGIMSAEDVFDSSSFDIKTTLGAIEFIIAYVNERFHCPIYFFSGAYFGDGFQKGKRQNPDPKGSEYGKLVDQVKAIAKKWNAKDSVEVRVIDLFHDEAFNALASAEYYAWAMNDPIHPTKAGYLQWWTPYFEARLLQDL